jgi:signal transduction histidine kinase
MTRDEAPDDGTEETQSMLIVPIKLEDKVTGVIQVMSFTRDAYNDDHLRFVEAIAPYAAIATQNARLFRQVQFQANRLEILHTIDKSALALQASTSIAQNALDLLQKLLRFERGGVLIRSFQADQTTAPRWIAATALPPDDLADFWHTIPQNSDAVVLDELDDGDRVRCTTPIMLGERLVGAITINYDRPVSPTPVEQRTLLEIAVQLALALQTQHLNEQLHQQNEELERRVQLRTEQLHQALAVERELSELKARLMSTISHELRNPVTTILTSGYILEKYADNLSRERQQEHVIKIQEQAQRMRRIMEDTLVMGRAEAAGLKPRFEPCDLFKICTRNCDDMRVLHEGRTLVCESTGTVRDVLADHELIDHIVSNLLSNALKYSAAPTPVHCKLHYNTHSMTLHIQDQGIGIPSEELAQIGEPFFRAHNVQDMEGTGLGLSLVYKIAHVHHGDVHIDSRLNEGTSVYVTLPYSPVPLVRDFPQG